jgi:hypothetical protein
MGLHRLREEPYGQIILRLPENHLEVTFYLESMVYTLVGQTGMIYFYFLPYYFFSFFCLNDFNLLSKNGVQILLNIHAKKPPTNPETTATIKALINVKPIEFTITKEVVVEPVTNPVMVSKFWNNQDFTLSLSIKNCAMLLLSNVWFLDGWFRDKWFV